MSSIPKILTSVLAVIAAGTLPVNARGSHNRRFGPLTQEALNSNKPGSLSSYLLFNPPFGLPDDPSPSRQHPYKKYAQSPYVESADNNNLDAAAELSADEFASKLAIEEPQTSDTITATLKKQPPHPIDADHLVRELDNQGRRLNNSKADDVDVDVAAMLEKEQRSGDTDSESIPIPAQSLTSPQVAIRPSPTPEELAQEAHDDRLITNPHAEPLNGADGLVVKPTVFLPPAKTPSNIDAAAVDAEKLAHMPNATDAERVMHERLNQIKEDDNPQKAISGKDFAAYINKLDDKTFAKVSSSTALKQLAPKLLAPLQALRANQGNVTALEEIRLAYIQLSPNMAAAHFNELQGFIEHIVETNQMNSFTFDQVPQIARSASPAFGFAAAAFFALTQRQRIIDGASACITACTTNVKALWGKGNAGYGRNTLSAAPLTVEAAAPKK